MSYLMVWNCDKEEEWPAKNWLIRSSDYVDKGKYYEFTDFNLYAGRWTYDTQKQELIYPYQENDYYWEDSVSVYQGSIYVSKNCIVSRTGDKPDITIDEYMQTDMAFCGTILNVTDIDKNGYVTKVDEVLD